ncbi:hypothetical protein Acsp03_63060 [Actinomadura sp. NBRC 104412]|uniref:hypothetical protein n=1 Tax=Actinomadura sp. NBRC 104412 TaxID=3032203 RepID=UPI0024A2E437|nr:hypothetical protein [Actinomadura sp. NBRC 104412]GLZ08840.1 hypothetical protein Acsp03_63060 [Actinomadura sp. NBRC 104412]
MRRLVYAGLGLMVLATGGYLVVYLARWEWQRSLMAGQLLLVCLIVLVAVAGAHRLRSLEQRIGDLAEGRAGSDARSGSGARPGSDARAGDRSGPRPVEPTGDEAPRFRWLEAETYSYKVFIPVLLGAGIIVSGLAALVERAASALGRGQPASRARVPESLALPPGGVLAGAPESVPDGRGLKVRLLGGGIALLLAGLAVVELAEHTQDRPDPPMREAVSTLVIQARTHGPTGAATTDPLATRLWEYCRGSTRPYLQGGGLVPLGGQRYALVVQPALGEHAMRRLRGCLEDAVIDHGRFSVVSVRHGG